MKRPNGQFDIFLGDQNADLDLGGRNHLDINTPLREGFEHCLRHPRMSPHPNADYRHLGNAGVGGHILVTDLGLGLPDDIERFMFWTDKNLYVYNHQGTLSPERLYGVITYCAQELKMKHMIMPGYLRPENSHYWADSYNGGTDVIFGHNVVGQEDIRVWENASGGRCYGIDTGCVFGGRLSALVLEENGKRSVVQVNAKREYSVGHMIE